MTKDSEKAPWEFGAGEWLCHARTGAAFRLTSAAERLPDGTYGYRAVSTLGRGCLIPLCDVVDGLFVRFLFAEARHGS